MATHYTYVKGDHKKVNGVDFNGMTFYYERPSDFLDSWAGFVQMSEVTGLRPSLVSVDPSTKVVTQMRPL